MDTLFVSETGGTASGASINIFDIPSGQPVFSLKTSPSTPQTLCALGMDYMVHATSDRSVLNVFDMNRSCQQPQKVVAPGVVKALCCSGDRGYIFAGIGDKIFAWDARVGDLLCILTGHYQDVTTLKTTSDSNLLISSGMDGVVSVWDIASIIECDISNSSLGSVQAMNMWAAHSLPVTCIACSAVSFNQTRIYSGSLDKTVKIHDVDLNQLLLTVPFHVRVCSLAVDTAETVLCVGGGDGNVYLVNLISTGMKKNNSSSESVSLDVLGEKSSLYTLFCSGHAQSVTCLEFSCDCSLLVSCAINESVKVWDLKSGNCLKSIAVSKSPKHVFTNIMLLPRSNSLSATDWKPSYAFPKLAHSITSTSQDQNTSVAVRLGDLPSSCEKALPNGNDIISKSLSGHQRAEKHETVSLKRKLIAAMEENQKICKFALEEILS